MNKLLTVLLKAITIASVVYTAGSSEGRGLKNFCYFTNWSNNIGAVEARFYLKNINTTLCTHLIYAFANINGNTMRLNPSAADDDNGKLGTEKSGRYFEFTGLKKDNPGLVTILSVGGAAAGSDGFIQIVQSEENMKLFSKNVAIYLRDRDFDGIDVDWEYPGVYKNKFTQLLKTMREEFEMEAAEKRKPRLVLTIAVGVGASTINESYNIPEISKYVDYMHVMTYDFHGKWSHVTSFSSPLYSRASNRAFSQELSQDWAIQKWLEGGAPANKLVMGFTATATTFVLKNSSVNGVGVPVADPGPAGEYLKQPGHCPYYHICTVLEKGATEEWDDEQKMAYAYHGKNWYGYNTARSLQEKVRYAVEKNLAGTMFWSLDLDDFQGAYCNKGKYPLLSAIHQAIVHEESELGGTTKKNDSNDLDKVTTPTIFHPRTSKDGVNLYNVRDSAISLRRGTEYLFFLLCISFISQLF